MSDMVMKVGFMVNVVDGPHKGKAGRVTEIYRDWKSEEPRWRAMIELPDKQGFFQTRIEWLVRMP